MNPKHDKKVRSNVATVPQWCNSSPCSYKKEVHLLVAWVPQPSKSKKQPTAYKY